MIRSTRLNLALALPLALTLSACGDGLDTQPNLSGPAGTASGGVTATPTPAAAATPTPTPVPTPGPVSAGSCTLPARPDCGNSGCCSRGGAELFGGAINDAQAHLERTRPDIFNSNGSLKLEELEYTQLLAKTLMQLNPGMCARGGGENGESYSKDEVAIKVNNDVSQNVDVIIGSSHTPYIGDRYTCRPASF
jgi:hypothetical protein